MSRSAVSSSQRLVIILCSAQYGPSSNRQSVLDQLRIIPLLAFIAKGLYPHRDQFIDPSLISSVTTDFGGRVHRYAALNKLFIYYLTRGLVPIPFTRVM